MLVLSRRETESVRFPVLGITVTVLRVAGRAVRLGIEAPKDIDILRNEVPHVDLTSALPEMRSRFKLIRSLITRMQAESASSDAPLSQDGMTDLLKKLDEIEKSVADDLHTIPQHRGRRALIVEDNSNESRLLAGFLRLHNFEVDTASNGASAMHFLTRQEVPDFVLLDMNMPCFDGRWTIGEIRRHPRLERLPVFAVSGIHPAEYGVEVGPRGCNRWFSKPLDPEALVRAVLNDQDTRMVKAGSAQLSV